MGVWEIAPRAPAVCSNASPSVAWKRTEAARLRCRALFTFAMNPFPPPQAQAAADLHAYFRTLYPTFDATLARCGGFVDLTLHFLGGIMSSSEVDEELTIRRPLSPPSHPPHHHPAHLGGDATPPPPPPPPPIAADVEHEKDVFAILGFTASPLYRYAFCFVLFCFVFVLFCFVCYWFSSFCDSELIRN